MTLTVRQVAGHGRRRDTDGVDLAQPLAEGEVQQIREALQLTGAAPNSSRASPSPPTTVLWPASESSPSY